MLEQADREDMAQDIENFCRILNQAEHGRDNQPSAMQETTDVLLQGMYHSERSVLDCGLVAHVSRAIREYLT